MTMTMNMIICYIGKLKSSATSVMRDTAVLGKYFLVQCSTALNSLQSSLAIAISHFGAQHSLSFLFLRHRLAVPFSTIDHQLNPLVGAGPVQFLTRLDVADLAVTFRNHVLLALVEGDRITWLITRLRFIAH